VNPFRQKIFVTRPTPTGVSEVARSCACPKGEGEAMSKTEAAALKAEEMYYAVKEEVKRR